MANFTFTRGDTVVLSGSVTFGGDPYNLAGATIWCTAKSRFTDADEDAIFQKTIGSGIVIVNAAAGLYTITIDPADTVDLAKVKNILVYDVQLKDADNKVFTIASGNLIINPDVTNA
jgi:hypothetical protein